MNSQMYPHQIAGALRISTGVPTYLGFDMGIGKSRTFIEGCKAADCGRILIICPKSAVGVWKREIGLWDAGASLVAALRPADLKAGPKYTILTHGALSQREGWAAETLMFCPAFDKTAIDEAHGFNAAENIRVKALRLAMKKLGHVVPLSGTPMRNHAGDLFTLTQLCWPSGLVNSSGRPMNRYEYEERFCVVAEKRFNGRRVRVIEGSKNLGALKALLAPFMVRVRKDEVLKDLPPVTWETVPVDIDGFYAQQIATMSDDIDGNDVESMLTSKGAGAHIATLRRILGVAKLRGAEEYIVDMLDNLPASRKILVFAVHTDVITHLVNHLAAYSPAVVTGAVTGQDRDAAVQKFLTDDQCRVFVGNIQAAGTALTLVGPKCKCSDVVFVESSWTPMDNAQAACRVHRIGQRDGVTARMLSTAGTIDELIQKVLTRKSEEFTQLFDKGDAT